METHRALDRELQHELKDLPILHQRKLLNRHGYLVLKIATAFIFLTSTASFAEECFNSSKKLNDDAQTIRLKAMDMGWTVGKSASVTAAGIVKGKAEIYPKDNVEICLREEEGNLQVRAQSKSRDANEARWRDLMAKKTGKERGDKTM